MRRCSCLSAVLAIFVAMACGISRAQNSDFAHDELSAQTVYPTQASVLAQLALQAETIVGSSQPILACGGSNAYPGNDVADSEWGTIALLTFWWYQNNGSAAGFASLTQSGHTTVTQNFFQTFAQTELSYAMPTSGGNPCDVQDSAPATSGSAYLRKINGYYYSKYTAAETVVSDADYEETALSLIYKAIIYQYNTTPSGMQLFSTTQLAPMITQAQSNWSWLTVDAVYNPEHTSNQVMMAILGGYWLGLITNSTTQMSAALNYYDGGLANSNLAPPNGFRQTEIATNAQGYKYFTEHYRCIIPTSPPTVLYDPPCSLNGTAGSVQLDGFDTHYSGLQLTEMVQMINAMNQGNAKFPGGCSTNNGNSCIGPNVYSDALAEAQYSSDRLSQGGTMHGGSRHNEIGATATDITFGAGYNYFGSILPADLGRPLVTIDSANGTAHPTEWGHRSSETIFLYLNWQPWVNSTQKNPITVNDLAALRRNAVSVTFDSGNQPQEVSVFGTVMTDALRGSVAGSTANKNTAAEEFGINGKAQGLQMIDANGNVLTPSIMSTPTYDATTNFTLHTTVGNATSTDGSSSIRKYYITDGGALYILSLVQFSSATSSLTSIGDLLGMPYISTANRLVQVKPVNGLSACYGPYSVLDLSDDTGYCQGTTSPTAPTALVIGDVDIYAWPQIYAEAVDATNTSGSFIWMSQANLNGVTNTPIYLETLDGLSNASPPWYYYPNSSSNVINYTGDIRTVMQPTAGATAYKSGDVIASVARIAPASYGNSMQVNTSYKAGSSYNLALCTNSPCLDVEDTTVTGSMSFQLSSSGIVTFTDKGSGQTITSPELLSQTITATAIANQTYGVAPIPLSSFNGSASSGLTVSYSVVSGPASISGSNLNITGAGNAVLQATQAGNTSYQPAAPVSLMFQVNPAPLTLTAANASIVYGTSLPSFSGTITGVIGTDAVTETFSANTPGGSPVPAGTYTITPGFAGAAASNYVAAAVTTGTLTVSKATPTLTLSSSNTNAVAGTSVTLTAGLQLPAGSATGTVSFMDGTTTLNSQTAAVGNLIYNTSTLSVGTHTLTATYTGDNNVNGITSASVTETITADIAPAFQFTASSNSLTLSRSQAGTINFSLPSAGGYAHIVSFSSSGVPANVTVQLAPASLTFTGANDTKTMTATFTRSASAKTENPFGFKVGIITSLALLLPVFFRRKRFGGFTVACFACALSLSLLAVVGCGSTSGSSATTPPPVTATVQITATDGTTSLSTPITLTLP